MKIDFSRSVLLALFIEHYEFGALEDTRENIEASLSSLTLEGRLIVVELKEKGIDTSEKVDKLSSLMDDFRKINF